MIEKYKCYYFKLCDNTLIETQNDQIRYALDYFKSYGYTPIANESVFMNNSNFKDGGVIYVSDGEYICGTDLSSYFNGSSRRNFNATELFYNRGIFNENVSFEL